METPKFLKFLEALERLCREHAVTLDTSDGRGGAHIQVFDFDETDPTTYPEALIIEDCTILKPPPGYTADELERDNPFNAWMREGEGQ